MFKYSDLNYNDFYSSEHCRRENKDIKELLDFVCKNGETVLDLGAGTGLVYSMIGERCEVTQVEKDSGMRKQNPFPNFINSDARRFLDNCLQKYDHVVSLFALNYMPAGTLTKAVEVSNSTCVFVVYNEPYKLGSSSFYCGKRLEFMIKCFLKKILINREVEKLASMGYSVKTYNLCSEPYYKVIVVK